MEIFLTSSDYIARGDTRVRGDYNFIYISDKNSSSKKVVGDNHSCISQALLNFCRSKVFAFETLNREEIFVNLCIFED